MSEGHELARQLDQTSGRWLVGFVPPLDVKWWHRFIYRRHLHCFALRRERPNQWTLFDPQWTHAIVRTIDDAEAEKYMRRARRGDLLSVDPIAPTRIDGLMNCARLCTHMLGRRYWVLTAHQLYRRLVAEPSTKLRHPDGS